MYTIFKTFIITLLVIGYSISGHSQQDATNDIGNIGPLIGEIIIDYTILEQKIALNTYQGLCMRRIIRESKTGDNFNITTEMEDLRDQLRTLSASLMIMASSDSEDLQQEVVDTRLRFNRLEDRLLNDCPDENGVF